MATTWHRAAPRLASAFRPTRKAAYCLARNDIVRSLFRDLPLLNALKLCSPLHLGPLLPSSIQISGRYLPVILEVL